MLTDFGKLLRKIRIDCGELLRDMAERLNVTPSYLSAIEIGKRNVPKEWPEAIKNIYNLSYEQHNELCRAASESKTQIKFNMNTLETRDRNLVLSFAREFKELNDSEKDQIFSILNRRNV